MPPAAIQLTLAGGMYAAPYKMAILSKFLYALRLAHHASILLA